jgi:biopolymer transport protein ExbD
MRFGERRGDEHIEINVVPFIDVLLVLLIFFLVATSFLETSRLHIALPRAEALLDPADQLTLRVSIDRNGRVEVAEQILERPTVETLAGVLRGLEGGGLAERPVVIAADAEARHQDLVTVMDALRQLGVRRLAIATVAGPG